MGKLRQAPDAQKDGGAPQKKREGAEAILGKLHRPKIPERIKGRKGTFGARPEMAFGYCVGGLRALYSIATTSQVPIGMRLEAAMKLADASMVIMKPTARAPSKAVRPEEPSETPPSDEPLDELPSEELARLLGGELAPAATLDSDEEIPVGWGQEPSTEKADRETPPAPATETPNTLEETPPKKRKGRPAQGTIEKMLRQVKHYGPLTKSQLGNRMRGQGFLLPKDFEQSLEYLCERAHLERLQRGPRRIIYYGTAEQIELAKEHGQ